MRPTLAHAVHLSVGDQKDTHDVFACENTYPRSVGPISTMGKLNQLLQAGWLSTSRTSVPL